jgi:hypothetical protein
MRFEILLAESPLRKRLLLNYRLCNAHFIGKLARKMRQPHWRYSVDRSLEGLGS